MTYAKNVQMTKRTRINVITKNLEERVQIGEKGKKAASEDNYKIVVLTAPQTVS